MQPLSPYVFKKQYLPYALESERLTGISALFSLAQAALETGWGAHTPGNMFFGIKATALTPDHLKQLVRATSPRFSASPRYPMANTYTWSRTGFAAMTPPLRASCTTPDCSPATLATAKHSSTVKTLSPLLTSSHKQAMPPTPTTKANSGELYERSMNNDQ